MSPNRLDIIGNTRYLSALPICVRVYGPPGCGKTTELLAWIADLHDSGVRPEAVAFSSFTRQARRVAQERVKRQFGFNITDVPHYRTLHAHAFHALGLKRGDVIGREDWEIFAKTYHYDLTLDGLEVDRNEWETADTIAEKIDDHLPRLYDWTRNRLLSLEDGYGQYVDQNADSVVPPLPVFRQYVARYEAFKAEREKVDFTDMLVFALREHGWPAVRWLIVDEAQDLNPLMMAYVMAWAKEVEGLILAADPDQAIYTFAGAAPELFERFDGHRVELTQSYRLPARVHAMALRVRGEMRRHSGVQYRPSEDGGRVDETDLAFLDWGAILGEVFDSRQPVAALARTNFLVNAWADYLIDEGIPFRRVKGMSPLDDRSVNLNIYQIVRQIERGERPMLSEWLVLLEKAPVQGDTLLQRGARENVRRAIASNPSARVGLDELRPYGTTEDFDAAIGRRDWKRLLRIGNINQKLLDYYRRVERRWGVDALTDRPRVEISTIHGYKGGEATRVLLDCGISRRVQRGADVDPDAELRVGYVGVTRAARHLTLVRGTAPLQAMWSA